ncbi:penicillin-binding protein activator [Coralliovum pocilloporae]|uniref:penicillin-binding protein activator n=1 Tax=Coralliovum pocilloporae TaxID=3066369 RepID=UPI003306BCDD
MTPLLSTVTIAAHDAEKPDEEAIVSVDTFANKKRGIAGLFSRRTAAAVTIAAAGLLAACQQSINFGGTPPPGGVQTPTLQTNAPPQGELLGAGSVRVALLAPLSANGNTGRLAQTLRNAAELALNDFQGADIHVVVKDTGGRPDQARIAAEQAVAEGAELIIGPLISANVKAVGTVARPANVPVIAFSTDVGAAARGIHLLSFLPQNDVQAIVGYASSQGRRSYAALIPQTSYGTVVEAAFRQEVARRGGRIVSIERYAVNSSSSDFSHLQEPANRIAQVAPQVDAIFLPDAGDIAPFMAQILSAAKVDFRKVKLLGTGQWNDKRIFNESTFRKAWFPGPGTTGFKRFSDRYQAAYNSTPPRVASLGYDAVILAAGLVRAAGPERFSNRVLTNADGFLGIDGVFRFLQDGTNQRGLAIYEVTNGGSREINPAPRSFRNTGF